MCLAVTISLYGFCGVTLHNILVESSVDAPDKNVLFLLSYRNFAVNTKAPF